MDKLEPKIPKARVVSFRTSESIFKLIEDFMGKNNIKTRQDFCDNYLLKKFIYEECDYDFKIRD